MLTAQRVTLAGLRPVFTAAVNNDQFTTVDPDAPLPGRPAFLHVKNAGALAVTVTVTAQKDTHSSSVAAGSEAILGPFTTKWALDQHLLPANLSLITYSAIGGVTVALLSL